VGEWHVGDRGIVCLWAAGFVAAFQPQRLPCKSPKRTPRITGSRAFDAFLSPNHRRLSGSIWASSATGGRKAYRMITRGVPWMKDAGNLFVLLTSLATQEDFGGLNLTNAAALVRAHLLSHPPS